MVSSYSTDLKLEIMVTGENAGTWGDITNTNLFILQQAIAGYESISIAGGAQTTALTFSNGATSNGKNAVIKLTGAITGNQIVTIPDSIEKTYIVENGTSGAFTVQFKTVSGTGPTWSTVDKGIKFLYSDGTNIVDVNSNLSASSFEQINLPTQNEIRFEDASGGQYVALKAGTTVASNVTFTLPTADGSSGQFLQTNGSGALSFADSGLAWQSVQTASFTAVAGRAYPVNTTSGSITVTLPASPAAGNQIQIVDYAGTADTNAIIINPNGNKIESGTSNLALIGEREGAILTYIDSTQGWIATSGINEGTDALGPPPYSIDFLVIAGGAGGGFNIGGGGGAGGYRTSTQTVTPGTVITVTVGDGGAGATTDTVRGAAGSDSSISGAGLTTITSTGGGGGGSGGSQKPENTGGTGGSGGGTNGDSQSGTTPGGAGNTPSTSPSQGNNGGSGIGQSAGSPHFGCGGGGGAGAVGVNGSNTAGGNGGAGTASSITGSSVTRAGGGGGGTYNGGTAGTGGTGGGGNGSVGGSGTAATNGTANTGSGGGGEGRLATGDAGSGGKGVVILSMPTASYSGTTTGSPTVTTSGSNTILQFNGSGSYTA